MTVSFTKDEMGWLQNFIDIATQDLNPEEELYSIMKKCIKKEYSDGYDSKIRVKVIELESELISKSI